jgi:hypothetical protein
MSPLVHPPTRHKNFGYQQQQKTHPSCRTSNNGRGLFPVDAPATNNNLLLVCLFVAFAQKAQNNI